MDTPASTVADRQLPHWPLLAALAALVFYAGTAGVVGHLRPAHSSYFEHLAQAFLDGRLYLADPPGTSDLTPHQGRWYVPFLPLAAVLMLPWVALAGVEHTNTVAFSIVLAAINVGLVAAILERLARRGWITLDASGRRWLVVVFAAGCVHWQVALEGSVWFVAHVCTLTFVGLAVYAVLRNGSPWWCGLALAVALWSRPTVIFTWALLLGIAVQARRQGGGLTRGWLAGWIARSAVPLALSVAGLAVYNYARFGDPLDFGYQKQKVSAEVLGDLARGQFHPAHIPRNLHTLLLAPPQWLEPSWAPSVHIPLPESHGMSILLTTPAVLYVLRAWGRREPWVRGAWWAVGLTLLVVLMYYNTGWRQFGYRFALDFFVPLLMLMALGLGTRMSRLARAAVVLGVLVNAWGVVWWYTSWLD